MVAIAAIIRTFGGMRAQDSDVSETLPAHTSGHTSRHNTLKTAANNQAMTPLLQEMIEPPRG